jgi:hypothetical protein
VNTAPKKTTHRTLASLKLPKPVPALIVYAEGILKAMTGNPHFPSPVPPLTALSGALADLQSAETAALARTKGAVATRNAKRAALVGLLQHHRAYVQSQADASPEVAPAIIESAGMAVKKVPTHSPRVFSAKPGTVSGAVKVVAPLAARRSSYEWEYSTDGGKTWVALPPTLQARTTVTGLTPGSSAQFRYRAVTKAGAADWSLPITLPSVK